MRHQPGVDMVADVGTKPLSSVKLKEHKRRLGMSIQEPECKVKKWITSGERKPENQGGERLRLALMMALIVRGRAQGKEEKGEEQRELEVMMVIYTFLIVVIALLLQRVWSKRRRSLSKSDKPVVQETEGEPLKRPTFLKEWTEVEGHTEEEPVRPLDRAKEGLKEDPKEKKTRRLEDRAVEETARGLALSSTEGLTRSSATSSSSGLPVSRQEELQRNKITKVEEVTSRNTSWLVAGNGKRYHRLRHCTGVKNSKQVREVKVCQLCYEGHNGRIPENATLFAEGINHVMHTSRERYDQCHKGQTPRTFEPCQVCQPAKTR